MTKKFLYPSPERLAERRREAYRVATAWLTRAEHYMREWLAVRDTHSHFSDDTKIHPLGHARFAINIAWHRACGLGSTEYWSSLKAEHDRLAKILALLERWEHEREEIEHMREEQREMREQFNQPPALQ